MSDSTYRRGLHETLDGRCAAIMSCTPYAYEGSQSGFEGSTLARCCTGNNATHLWTIAAACGASAILLNLMVHRPQSSVVQGDTSAVGYPRRRKGARASMGGPKPRSGPNPLSCFLGRGCPASVEVVLVAEETGAWVTGWPSYSPRASWCPNGAVLYLHLIACQFRADS